MIIVDCNALCHMAKHSMGELDYDGARTGVIFGFLQQLPRLAKSFDSNEFVFTWDSKTSLRKKIYPEYKANRNKEEKSAFEQYVDVQTFAQFDVLRTMILPQFGFKNIFIQDGFEADDIIASIVKHHQGWDTTIIIVSGDEDLFQLLNDYEPVVSMYSPYRKDTITAEKFYKEYGIDALHWSEVKAIAGCNTDNVKGIPGVAEKTAIRFLKGELPKHYKALRSIHSEDGQATIARNRPLVTLPYKGTPQFPIVDSEQLSLDAYLDICNRYNFQSMLSREVIDRWRQKLGLR